jgi:hypothetical protein
MNKESLCYDIEILMKVFLSKIDGIESCIITCLMNNYIFTNKGNGNGKARQGHDMQCKTRHVLEI